jgi:hypothetical protein
MRMQEERLQKTVLLFVRHVLMFGLHKGVLFPPRNFSYIVGLTIETYFS